MGKPKGESKGLEYLKRVRPEAIQHLLAFFGASGKHLEPKTRILISVVTKVISGSERGVAQYVRRALEEGASPDEVIDAVLCAYPCAGLTKVVDAIDTILDLGIEGFAPPQAPSGHAPGSAKGKGEPEPEWIDAGTVADIPPVCGRRVVSGLRDLALFVVGGEVLAIDNRCPHKGGSLAEGVQVDGVVTCPLHHWRFEVKTGRCPERPRLAIKTYPAKVEGGRVFVKV